LEHKKRNDVEKILRGLGQHYFCGLEVANILTKNLAKALMRWLDFSIFFVSFDQYYRLIHIWVNNSQAY
jgi:hypothetical protein